MASLMKKLFDTMPLAGVEGAILETVDDFKKATLGQVAQHLKSHAAPPAVSVAQPRPDIGKLRSILRDRVFDWLDVPIWGFDAAAGDAAHIKRVTCRVRDDNFNTYVVAEEIEFGHAAPEAPDAFSHDVEVVLGKSKITLPLSDSFHLMSFTTKGGYNNPKHSHWLWPLKARHDESLLHVFVYDVILGRGSDTHALRSLKDPSHPEAAEIAALRQRCEQINAARPDDERNVEEFLFKDDLWQVGGPAAPPTATVPESVDLSLRLVRIVVACSLTPCREHDDFQPGNPAGVGRLYPHIMVVSTSKLEQVNAGVRIARPSEMTLLDGEHCGCGEMLREMGSLLVTDSNEDAMVEMSFPGPLKWVPLIYWANIFNYYVVDPALDPELAGKPLPVVRHRKTKHRDEGGYVDRDCSDITYVDRGVFFAENQNRVTKFSYQGYFDNIHMAPKMRVTEKIDQVRVGGVVKKFTTYEDWKMDKVTMAPFCAHDCLHIHWRWTDSDNKEVGTFGWGAGAPNKVAGAPLVPENQEVVLFLYSPSRVSYLAQAHEAKADAWQPFFHHGAGYALSVGTVIALAKLQVAEMDAVRFERVTPALPGQAFPDYPEGEIQAVKGDWALFYWRLRYTFHNTAAKNPGGTTSRSLELKERFSFVSRRKALDL